MKRFALFASVLGASGAWANGSKKPATPAPQPEEKPVIEKSDPKSKSIARQLLVSFATEAAAAKRSELFATFKAREVERVGSTQLYLIELPEGTNLDEARKDLSQAPGVRFVEPNLQMRTFKAMGSGSENK